MRAFPYSGISGISQVFSVLEIYFSFVIFSGFRFARLEAPRDHGRALPRHTDTVKTQHLYTLVDGMRVRCLHSVPIIRKTWISMEINSATKNVMCIVMRGVCHITFSLRQF